MYMFIIVLTPFVIALICAIIWNVAYPQFLAHLQKHHNVIWHQLGSPTYFGWSYSSQISIIRFLWRRQYLTVGDTCLAKLGARARTALLGACASIVLFGMAGVLVQFILPHFWR